MKQINEFENISAYADDELPRDLKEEAEKKLASSDEFEKRLCDYKKIKELTAGIPKIPESPYFETRLFERLKEKPKPVYGFWRRYSPAFGVAAFTILLMFVFRFNTKDINKLIEKQKFNIVDLYAKNLKPILYNADISKEDIFNFAFYNQLPLNKETHQYLALGTEKNGNSYFEIKNANYFPRTNNLEKFMTRLNLNTKERRQVDSILESYIGDLRSQILVNDKNTIAINANLVNMNRAIAADLLSYAHNTSREALNQIIPAAYRFTGAPELTQMIKKVKNGSEKETYIFITPDTIFSEQFQFNMDEFEKSMKEAQKHLNSLQNNLKNSPELREMPKISKEIFSNLNKELPKLKKLSKMKFNNRNFSLYFDSNYCKIEMPKFDFPDFEMPDFDSIASAIESATQQYRHFWFGTEDGEDFQKFNRNYKDKFRKDSLKAFRFKKQAFGIPGLDSLKKKDFGNFSFLGDSLGRVFQNIFTDSMTVYDQKTMKEQMKNLNEQMKRFQKQIQKMQEDMQNIKPEKKEQKKKKPVEINSKRYYLNRTTPIIV
jgi:hypothetical protein